MDHHFNTMTSLSDASTVIEISNCGNSTLHADSFPMWKRYQERFSSQGVTNFHDLSIRHDANKSCLFSVTNRHGISKTYVSEVVPSRIRVDYFPTSVAIGRIQELIGEKLVK